MRLLTLVVLMSVYGCGGKGVPVAPDIQTIGEPTQSQQTTPVVGGETFEVTVILDNKVTSIKDAGYTSQYSAIYDAAVTAKSKWESVIVQGLPRVSEIETAQLNIPELANGGVTFIDDMVIVVRFKVVYDGDHVASVPFIAVRSGPTRLPYYSEVWLYDGFLDPKYTAQDRANILIHEFAHALGFNEYVIGETVGAETVGVIPYFNGANAIAAYREILYHHMGEKLAFGIPGLRVPMAGEKSHWRFPELQWDIMQPYAMPGAVITKVTIGAMEDLGYKVDYSQAAYPRQHLTKPAIGRPIFRCDGNALHRIVP